MTESTLLPAAIYESAELVDATHWLPRVETNVLLKNLDHRPAVGYGFQHAVIRQPQLCARELCQEFTSELDLAFAKSLLLRLGGEGGR